MNKYHVNKFDYCTNIVVFEAIRITHVVPYDIRDDCSGNKRNVLAKHKILFIKSCLNELNRKGLNEYLHAKVDQKQKDGESA